MAAYFSNVKLTIDIIYSARVIRFFLNLGEIGQRARSHGT